MGKVNKNNQYVKYAIYNAYGGKCFYTNKPLDIMNMQIDHIIPESLESDKEKLRDLLDRCGLDDDFELNSLNNLVPTSSFENRRKSDLEYNEKTIMHYLELTSKMVPKIQKEIEKLKKKTNYEKDILNVKTYIDEACMDNNREKEKVLEKLVSFINNENEDFIECEGIYEFEGRQIYKKYAKRIGIEATLPEYNNCETECILYLKTFKISDCKIILENETILKELFGGLFSEPKHGIRGFIEVNKDLKDDLTAEDFEVAVIKLGNNRLKLNFEDISLLCEVVDSFAEIYISKIKEIESTLKTSRFQLSKRRNSYKFISVTPEQWYRMIKFANSHDVDNWYSRWNIFDKHHSFIKVFTSRKHPMYEMGYHSFFSVEKDEDCVFYPSIASNKFVVTWQFIEDIDKNGLEFLNERENWDAEYAYNWLVNEFMLKVGIKLNRKKLFNRHAAEFEQLLGNDKIRFIEYINYIEIKNEDDFRKAIETLQYHFHCRANNKYRLKRENLVEIHSLLISCLSTSKKVDKYYICEKLGLGRGDTVDEIITKINEIIKNSCDRTLRGFDLDLIFRAFCALFKDNILNLNSRRTAEIVKQLDWVIDIYNRETLLDKYAISYLAW